MSFSPTTLQALAAAWVRHGGVNLGIVGDSAHPSGYHVGRDRIYSPTGQGDRDYSVREARDKAGLTNAACALDLGKLGGNLVELRAFTKWFVGECMAGRAPWVREVIYSDDGRRTVGWSALKPSIAAITGYSTQDHTTHSHLSFWRDTVNTVPATLFDGYFAPAWRLRIAQGTVVKVATVTPTGCIASWVSDASPWTKDSSAPCEKPVSKPGCVSGAAQVARATAGKYAGKWVRVGDGVTVEAA